MAISSIAKLAVTLCDIMCTVDAISACSAPEDGEESPLLKKANLVNKLAMLGFTVIELGARSAGVKAETLVKIKSFEIIPRVLNAPITAFQAGLTAAAEGEDGVRPVLKFLQKGVIAPLADVVRVTAEESAYEEQAYLEMTPEERASRTRDVYEYDPFTESLEVVGHKPIDTAECQANLEAARTVATGASFVRVGAEVAVVNRAIDATTGIYQRIQNYLARFRVQVRNLRELPLIPPPLHEDVVLSRYMCPILHQPIRHPVMDPTNHMTIYEESAIRTWLAGHPVSPYTAHHLTADELIPMPALQNLIDARLEEHDRNFNDYLLQTPAFDARLHAPAAPAAQAAADAEHPGV